MKLSMVAAAFCGMGCLASAYQPGFRGFFVEPTAMSAGEAQLQVVVFGVGMIVTMFQDS